ncbi:hypothetical protein L0B53_18505 (plasmid) [Vibrio sp. SS-MA-C1-2]|nr:hypothetical protein [Vibrio sp. SS-MA-C1-2]UJF20317.1 hypothetical protein L0B53_18505 [Vibrio sp. SS-MA-C1-2]
MSHIDDSISIRSNRIELTVGQPYLLMGPSGIGKSYLMACLASIPKITIT